jgi:hypothetical protein
LIKKSARIAGITGAGALAIGAAIAGANLLGLAVIGRARSGLQPGAVVGGLLRRAAGRKARQAA